MQIFVSTTNVPYLCQPTINTHDKASDYMYDVEIWIGKSMGIPRILFFNVNPVIEEFQIYL